MSLLLCGLTLLLPCSAQAQNDYPGSTGYDVTYSADPSYQGKDFDSQPTFSNPVTATLTWHGDGPAPAVIVEEDAVADWFVDGCGTGTCSCGLPNATHDEYLQGGDDYATRYTIYPAPPPGADTITLPTVTTSGSTTLADWEETDNFVNLSYTVTPTPVILTLSGTIKDTDGSDNILIGQGCTGTLSAGGFTLSNFQWTIPGDTFYSYVMGTTQEDPYHPPHSYGRVTYLMPSVDLAAPSPHWFWKKGYTFAVDQTVSCSATASINGTAIGTVTGQQDVAVWAPYHQFGYNIGPGNSTAYTDNGTASAKVESNITFSGAMGVEQLFYSAYGSCGVWQFTQLCNLYRTGPPYFWVSTQGQYVLDAEFNYSSRDGSPWLVDSVDSSIPGHTLHNSGDSPNQSIYGPLSFDITDTYLTYQMYLPPGTDVSWVPLHRMGRTWNANLTVLGLTWSPDPPGSQTVNSEGPSSEFPVWEDVFTGTG